MSAAPYPPPRFPCQPVPLQDQAGGLISCPQRGVVFCPCGVGWQDQVKLMPASECLLVLQGFKIFGEDS